MKAEYADVFQGLGRLKDSYSIEIDDSIRPVVHAPRRIPVQMRNKLHEKLEQLVNDGVITHQIGYPAETKWPDTAMSGSER